MKVGDLVKFKSKRDKRLHGKVFLVMRTRSASFTNDQEVWIYPDPDDIYDFADDDSFYFASGFEVVSEGR